MIISIDPATGEEIARFATLTSEEVDGALSAATTAQANWQQVSLTNRVALLVSLAKVLRAGKARFAAMIVREMGKPVVEAEGEIEKCAWNCDFYAENASIFLADEIIESSATESSVVFDPLGVVLAVMPWNYPFWQLFRFAAPALAAGNGIVLKHASNVCECALAIEGIFREAGSPEGLFRTLLIDAKDVAKVISDPRIAAVTFTGSTEVGSSIASVAGKAIKKQVLELGGSDPFIVLADADIARAATAAVSARYINVGQSCVNAKRFIVDKSIADEFVDAFCSRVRELKIGDPIDRDTQIGPLARSNLRDTLHRQVEHSVVKGAHLRQGGEFIERPGFYYAPTVLDHVTAGMPAFDEETFGPVAAIIRAGDTTSAIELANRSEFGLGAALWTRDLSEARRLARQLQAGAVFINGIVASDPRLPFGGIKKSGYGRELGIYGIREFTNIKTVWIGPSRT